MVLNQNDYFKLTVLFFVMCKVQKVLNIENVSRNKKGCAVIAKTYRFADIFTKIGENQTSV